MAWRHPFARAGLSQHRQDLFMSRTPVRYPEVVTERPRIALRQPRSLQPEQLGQLTGLRPCRPAEGERLDPLGGRRRGTGARPGCRLDEEGCPGQVWGTTTSARGVGLGGGGTAGLTDQFQPIDISLGVLACRSGPAITTLESRSAAART